MEPTKYVNEFAYKLEITQIKIVFIITFTKGKKIKPFVTKGHKKFNLYNQFCTVCTAAYLLLHCVTSLMVTI